MKKIIMVLLVLLLIPSVQADPFLVRLNTTNASTEHLGLANHTNSLVDGNWLILSGGTSITIPNITFTYRGVEVWNYVRGDFEVNITSQLPQNENYVVDYPTTSFPFYQANQPVTVTFNGASDFAIKSVDLYLVKTSAANVSHAVYELKNGSTTDLRNLLNGTVNKTNMETDESGDLSITYTGLAAGDYVLFAILNTTGNPYGFSGTDLPILDVTTFQILEYSSTLTTNSTVTPGTNVEANIQLNSSASGTFRYGATLWRKAVYKLDLKMTSQVADSTNITANGAGLLENFKILGSGLGGVNRSAALTEIPSIFGTNNGSITISDSYTSSTSSSLTLTTTDLPTGDYYLLIGAWGSSGKLVAFNQTKVTIGVYNITGQVYNTSANIPSATVYLVNASNSSTAATATTNSTGGYRIEAPYGTYYLYATHTNHKRSSNTASFTLSADKIQGIQMTPLLGKFVGVVYSGSSVTNYTSATVKAYLGSTAVNTTSTNSSGEYEFYVTSGTYDLYAVSGTYKGWSLSQSVGTNGVTQSDIEVNATTFTISGNVSDSINGSYRISGAKVAIDGVGTATTNSNGYYEITGVPKLPTGDYTITANATNYSTKDVLSGTVTADKPINISLTPQNGSISGTVKDVNGNGIKNATITVTNKTSAATTHTTTTDSQGLYVVTDVEPWTTYNVTADGATAKFNHSNGSTTMTQGGTKTVDITLTHVKISAAPAIQVAPDSPIKEKNFTITIDNKGQSQTTFDIGLLVGNTSKGENATLSKDTLVIGASSTNTTTLSVNSSVPGYYNFTVNATSQDDSDVYSNVTVYLGIFSNATAQLLVATQNDTASNFTESVVIDATVNTTNSTKSLIIGSTAENATLTDSVVKENSSVNATTLTNATVEGSTVKDAIITESTLKDSTIENSSTITGSSSVEDSIVSQTAISSSSTVEDSNLSSSTITGSTVVGYDATNVTITSNTVTTATVADKTASLTTPEGVEFNLTSTTLTENVALNELVPASETITKTDTNFATNVTDKTTGKKAVEIDIDSGNSDTNLIVAKTKIPAASEPIYNTPPGVGYLYIKDKKGNLQNNIQAAMIKLYYDRNNLGTLNESSLRVQWYNGTGWSSASEDDNNNGVADVEEMTVATQAVHGFDGYVCPYNPTRNIPGTRYCGIVFVDANTGYAFANVTHLSVYGMEGSVYGGEAGVTTTVSPASEIRVIAEPDGEFVITAPSQTAVGTSTSIVISLTNLRTVPEDYTIAFIGLPAGWVVTGDPLVKMSGGEQKDITYSLRVPADAAPGTYTFTVKFAAVNWYLTREEEVTIKVTAEPVPTAPPVITAPPVTTAPPVITAPPITTAPPVTTAPPITTRPPVTTAPPVVTIAPPKTTVPPKTTPPPLTTAPPKPEKKRFVICGPTTILLLALISALGVNILEKRKIGI